MAERANESSPWLGFHHLALVTPDLDATILFYRDVLGMQLFARGDGNPIHGRTALFVPGGDHPMLHFFELANAQIFTPSPDAQNIPWIPGALHHIGFGVPDEAAAQSLRERRWHTART